MEVRQLHYFLTLCEELNYSRAAQRLYLSRQALRQNIAALEQELGEPLFLNQQPYLPHRTGGVAPPACGPGGKEL